MLYLQNLLLQIKFQKEQKEKTTGFSQESHQPGMPVKNDIHSNLSLNKYEKSRRQEESRKKINFYDIIENFIMTVSIRMMAMSFLTVTC